MKEIFRKSVNMLNSNLKEILIFSIMIHLASFASSMFLPLCGVVLSTMIAFYVQQVFIKSTSIECFDRDSLPEPNYKGILKSYGFNLILSIPSVVAIFIGFAVMFAGTLRISILSLSNWDFGGMISSMFTFILFLIIVISLFVIMTQLIFPFASFVLLDEDFSQNGFFSNISLSFKLAKGYRCKMFIAMLINYLLTLLSILTLGLSLVYTYPLYVILTSYIYNDSKNKFFDV